jgi:hypothetical protein
LAVAARVTELERENDQLSADLATLRAEHVAVKEQLAWLKRQLFGVKSEKRLDVDPPEQGNLFAALGVASPPPKVPPAETVTLPVRIDVTQSGKVLRVLWRARELVSGSVFRGTQGGSVGEADAPAQSQHRGRGPRRGHLGGLAVFVA